MDAGFIGALIASPLQQLRQDASFSRLPLLLSLQTIKKATSRDCVRSDELLAKAWQ